MRNIGTMAKLVSLILALPCSAQEAQPAKASLPRFGKAVRSPQVDKQGRITFRLRAPNANEVVLARQGVEPALMTKDQGGDWQITIGPLPPDLYVYQFYVDGVAFADPGNPLSKPIVTGGQESIAHVPGPASLAWEINDVPRGIVRVHAYGSATLGAETEFLVYTPPGYDEAVERKYPVLYLLHGVNDDARAWTTAGRAHVIMDNLIARQEAEPMLVVMPLGYGFADPADRVGTLFQPMTNHRKLLDAFANVLLEEVIPMVERSYRIDARREARALAGLSMGGTQALYIGLHHPQQFGWIGSFSGAVIMFGQMYDFYFPDMPAAADRSDPKIWLACGTEDFLLGPNRGFQKWLKSNAVVFQAVERPGGHTWNRWRRDLAQFAGLLFRKTEG